MSLATSDLESKIKYLKENASESHFNELLEMQSHYLENFGNK